MEIFKPTSWNNWERFYRANFINSLTGFKSATLIGSINDRSVANLGIFSSIVHLGSDPALIGYFNRPEESSPHTLNNIRNNGFYTMNHIGTLFIDRAHQTSAKYPEGLSEFGQVGLTPQYEEGYTVPFVKESKLKYLLSLKEVIPIKLNNTFLVIGQLECVLLEKPIIEFDGLLSLDKIDTVTCNGSTAYYNTSLIDRFEYAKPYLPLKSIIESVK